ncbi:hypothetical protein ACP70R_006425 [Stipagrostis hirtigluma subsp. patula]
MEAASSSAPGTAYPNISLAQAVLTLSVDSVLLWLSASINPSSSSSARRAAAAPASAPPPAPVEKTAAAAGKIDMDVVLGVMGAGPAPVGFEEAAALFDEEEATLEEARAAFAVFDRDGDGFIGAEELGAVLGSLGFGAGAADCRRMIRAYDEDKDGRIDFHEFLKLMERGQ